MKLLPVIFLAGDARILKDEYVENFCKKRRLKRIKVNAEEKDGAFNLLSQAGLFFDEVLLDVVDFDEWKREDQKKLLEMAESSKISVIVRTEESVKAKEVVQLSLPKPWEHEKWIDYVSERLRKHNISTLQKIAELIFDRVGPNDELLEREIEKLACVTDRPTEETIQQVISQYVRSDIDEFCFRVSMGDFEKAHALLGSILKTTEPIVVVASLARHFLDLYKIVLFVEKRENYPWPVIKEVSEKLGVGLGKTARFLGFSFKGTGKSVNHVSLYDAEKLEKILERLYWLDLTVKSSPTPNLAIHSFLDQVQRITGEKR